MPRKSRRLGPRWTIPGKLALKAKWQTDRPAMLARSKAGTEASRRTYADRLTALRDFVASWPSQLTMQDIKGRIEADRSRAEDLDMPQAISEFQSQQTGYDSALKTYAAVQRLSLFNYIS